jgi:hypothetical protein
MEKQRMATPANKIKGGRSALKDGALSSLIPASVYLVLHLLNLLIHNLDQTVRYIFNIVSPIPQFIVGVYTNSTPFTIPSTYIAYLIYCFYEGLMFGAVVALIAAASSRWAVEQRRKASTALLQGLWIGCCFGVIASLINIVLHLIQFGSRISSPSDQGIIFLTDQYGFAPVIFPDLLVEFLLYYLVISLLAISLGILGSWLSRKWSYKLPLSSPM